MPEGNNISSGRPQGEVPWREASDSLKNQARGTLQVSAGFYEKLVALDAGSIAIAASVGVALVARATPPTEIVRSLSHWLVCIIFTFLFSLVLGVAHNLIAVWIVQVDTYMDELEFVRKLMGQYWNLIGAAIHYTDPNLSSSDILEKIRSDEMHRQKRQRRTLTVKELLREALPVAGYGSILFFATSYVLVAICTLRLWL